MTPIILRRPNRICASRRRGGKSALPRLSKRSSSVLALMPTETVIERRNRALIAFTILSGARDGALASFRLKHLDLKARTCLPGRPRSAHKGAQNLRVDVFPRGANCKPEAIVADYVAMLTG